MKTSIKENFLDIYLWDYLLRIHLLNLPSLVEQAQISNESPLSEPEIKKRDQLWIKESKHVGHADGLTMLDLPLSKVF
ncbi:hypothetical protein LCGC14_0558450 [marine sediment metagenome]|uniref:Uncharacterized protein n=1 Tax=marine sediment metagenome TaxID=412755 RepID=A0A0F9RSW6_9ZZZZ|nr:hypothetical protein [Pseudoalteromonas sp.]